MGDYRQLLMRTPEQIDQALKLGNGLSVPKSIKRIVFCGMGGSGIAGDLLASILEPYGVEMVVWKQFTFPDYLVNATTLVIICSYSGNTVEMLQCYRSATKLNARVLVVSSGGTILASAQRQKLPHIHIPVGYLPRQSLIFQFFSILQVLINSEIIPNQSTAISEFKAQLNDYPFARRSNAIAKNVDNNVPIIYTAPSLYSAALRWKTQFNENAKRLCFINTFTELNHNEIEGYDKQVKNVSLVLLKREREPKIVQKQMEVFEQLIRSQVDVLKSYEIPGRSHLCALFIAVHLGDWASYQLAEMQNTDPDQVALITQLKSQIS
jgi:glucose/mannose-6-phosphate isomerase